MHVLVVDLLAEREGFGREGVREIVSHFDNPMVSLWSPHCKERVDYGFGNVVDGPVDADFIVITGSRKNVSMWEDWMDDVANLIQTTKTPMVGICFGHQIIAASLGGKVERAEQLSAFVRPVSYQDGTTVSAVFTHQDHVIDAGEMEVIASTEHCSIAACRHPTRPIHTVQYHPEAVENVINESLKCGDLTPTEAKVFDMNQELISVRDALIGPVLSL